MALKTATTDEKQVSRAALIGRQIRSVRTFHIARCALLMFL